MARIYGVSRQTARTAMQALEQEGLVVVRPRGGRIVRNTQRIRWHLSEFENPEQTVLTTSDAWETDVESQGHDPTSRVGGGAADDPGVAVSEFDGQGGAGDVDGDGLRGVGAAEGSSCRA